MKLKEFLENINTMVKNDPSLLELEVITSDDDEGNGFTNVYYPPGVGNYDEDDKAFKPHNPDELDEDDNQAVINAICVN